MSSSDAVSHRARGRLLLASIVAVIVVAAIAQQAVPGFHLATQFAEVPRHLPPAIAVWFPLSAILAQVVVVTRLSRWLERRKVGLVTGSLVSLGAGVLVCTGVSFFSAWLTGTAGTNPGLRVLKGLLSAFQIYGLWLLAYRYPRLAHEARVRELEVERLRNAAELMRLREHLQPHFLRNTLNAIAALVDEDPPEARNLLAAVADLLTDSIEDAAPERPLGVEIAWLRRYAEILEARYRGSLRFTWDEGPMTREGMIPRLLLQPLVENAVHHGALARTGHDHDGQVTVRTRTRSGGGTVIEIQDNGPGLSMSGAGTHGLGLRLVRQRVEQEARGSIRMETGPTGTRTIVELP
jgi:two-component sensor histidine kinase